MSHRPGLSIISLGSASLGLLAASLALHAAGCGASDTDLFATKGVCPSSFDDGNPCTLDACQSGILTHDVALDGAPCALGENSGTCKQGVCDLPCLSTPLSCKCSDPKKDCPAETACMGWQCDSSRCKSIPRTDTMLPTEEQTSGDCSTIVCSAEGTAVSATDSADTPDDDGPCTIGVCTGAGPAQLQRDVGAPCGGGQPGVCDSTGSCVACVDGTSAGCDSGQRCYKADGGKLLCAPQACFDQVHDGNETDTDCGGSCKPCALGGVCSKNEDCSNQICASSLGPGKGVCCESQCTGACRSCAEGTGQCADVPTGTPDQACNAQSKVCAQGAGCAFKASHACTVASDCISGICDNQKCFPGRKNAPCLDAQDCLSNVCDGNKRCVAGGQGFPCFDGYDCASTMCDAMTLKCQ